jgi:hypothetical protein
LTIAKIELLPEKSQRAIAAGLLNIGLASLERTTQRKTTQLAAFSNAAFQISEGLWTILCCICKDMKEAVKTIITQAISQDVPVYKAVGDVKKDTSALMPTLR